MSVLDYCFQIICVVSAVIGEFHMNFSLTYRSSKIQYIPPPTGEGYCPPGRCSNGSLAFGTDDPRLILDQLMPCQMNNITHNEYLGDIPLDPENYCDPKVWREVPYYSCCSPFSPDANFPGLFLFPIGSKAFYTKPIRLLWFNKNDGWKLPPTGDIIFLVHGFSERPLKKGALWLDPALQAWTLVRRKPVVVVTYTVGTFQYFQTAANLRTVGMALGYALINWGITHRTILVGASLGALVLGEAGKYTKKHGKLIKECTGLDPAGPSFDGGSPRIRITPEDCKLVQIVHSSSESSPNSMGVLSMQLGTFHHSGSCDFWINCGRTQGVACQLPTLGAMMNYVPPDMVNDSLPAGCSHYRGHVFYTAMVAKRCNFIGIECLDCAHERPTDGCLIDLNGTRMKPPPYNNCQPSDRKDFYIYVSGNNYPYCYN